MPRSSPSPSPSPSASSRCTIDVGYLVAQAVLGVAWWTALVASPPVRTWFELAPDDRTAFDAFLVPDLAVFIGGSLASAWLIWTRSRWATLATAFTAGGIAYATLYLGGWVVLDRSPAVGLVPMTVALVATTIIAIRTERGVDA